ncbi:MAG: hypothetical protein ACJ749_02420, partial [Flavisolibacter sp.]
DFKNWNAEAVHFFDNNRNILELIARRDLDNASQRPFGPGSFLGISEAGIVTDNVKATSSALMKGFGLEYFSRQPALQHFAAIGDDEGLFIVVSKNRNWFPTQITSCIHPIKINFVINHQEKFFEWPVV